MPTGIYARKPLKERFEAKYKVNPLTGCWDWTAYKDRDGYGQFGVGVKLIKAHRLSYELYKGQITEGFCVLHKCDQPLCVNPGHLFLGTRADNMRDKADKNRQAKGPSQGSSKLTELQVLEIRELYSLGNYSQKLLGKMFGVCQGQIQRILTRKHWAHLLLKLTGD